MIDAKVGFRIGVASGAVVARAFVRSIWAFVHRVGLRAMCTVMFNGGTFGLRVPEGKTIVTLHEGAKGLHMYTLVAHVYMPRLDQFAPHTGMRQKHRVV